MASPPQQQEMDLGRKILVNAEVALDTKGEESKAYEALRIADRLEAKFRLETSAQIEAVQPNSTRWKNAFLNIFCCPLNCCGCIHTFQVSTGHLQKVTDGRGNFMFYSKGVHCICDPFFKVQEAVQFRKGVHLHGDRCVCVVPQGHIGYVTEKGHPVLLPPGLHQWKSPTMVFERSFDLNNNVIRIGPLTLVTVDSGYAAVTEDNGLQQILDGGSTYLLKHKNHKFIKYLSSKIQSDDMKKIEATSADNVLMATDATVIWRISDVGTAALNAAETIAKDGKDESLSDVGSITKLRGDVLKQAEASLAAFIGAVNYSDSFNVAASVQKGVMPTAASAAPPRSKDSSPLFDAARMATCLDHANAVTSTYGVTILSINVVAAVPAEQKLMLMLAQGAVAAAEAQKFETVASGKAAAMKIEAGGEAQAEILQATGESKACQIRADGDKAAADLLQRNPLAVELQTIRKAGQAIGDNRAFFFNTKDQDVSTMLASSVVRAK